MTKSINWPAQYREVVLNEPTDTVFVACRPGRLYFDNQYWNPGETVYIRAGHKVIRPAMVASPMACVAIDQLTPTDLAALKPGLNTPEALADFLAQTYSLPITPQSEVSLVYYKNLAVDPELLQQEDDPHMVS